MKHHYLLIIAVLLCVLSSCKQEAPPKAQFAGMAVKTVIIEPKNIPADFEYVGFAQSSHAVEIRARVEGYLEEISFTEGGVVKKGDLLFELDRKPFEAALDNAKGFLAQQEAVLWNAKRNEDRLKPLFEQKAASRKDLDDATSQRLSAEAAIQSAKAKVTEAELNLGYATIKSPIGGLVADSNYREGALISPGQASLLTTVSIIDPIWINFSVSESELLRSTEAVKKHTLELPKDMNFEVEAVLTNDFIYPERGIVSFASPTIDQQTGTMSMRAVLPNSKGVIKPGQFLRARVLGAVWSNAITIPQRAVLHNAKGMFGYVVKDGKVEPRIIEVGEWYGNDWIILSGLKQGDEVIVDGMNKVQPGFPVIVVNSPSKPAE